MRQNTQPGWLKTTTDLAMRIPPTYDEMGTFARGPRGPIPPDQRAGAPCLILLSLHAAAYPRNTSKYPAPSSHAVIPGGVGNIVPRSKALPAATNATARRPALDTPISMSTIEPSKSGTAMWLKKARTDCPAEDWEGLLPIDPMPAIPFACPKALPAAPRRPAASDAIMPAQLATAPAPPTH